MDVACPQCGNPNLEVDAQNNVVYCKQCGFAVQVDPQTGNVVPISPGAGMPQGPGPHPPPAALGPSPAYSGGHKEILGTEPLTFFLLATTALLLLTFLYAWDLTWLAIGELIVFLVYWQYK